jgi:malate dehydrogenase
MIQCKPIHVAIAGAGGRVGYSLIFRIANGGLFGHEQPVSLSLLDLPEKDRRLQAFVTELKDGAYPLLTDARAGSDPVQMFDGADWVILLSGRPLRGDRQSHLDLLRDNAPIMIDHGRAINRASPSARVLVVSSPCNTNCLIALSHAQDVPREHWFALNQVIRSRALSLVAEKARVPITQITRLTVWGNNSETAFVDLHNGRICDQPLEQVINDPQWQKGLFEPGLVRRFAEVVRLTGETPAGSTAQAIMTTIRAITSPTPFEHYFGASVLSDGSYYEVPRGLVFGFPLQTSDGKSWTIPRGHYLDSFARERIAQNVAELELEASSVSHLLGKA